jgi:hypothetical protein
MLQSPEPTASHVLLVEQYPDIVRKYVDCVQTTDRGGIFKQNRPTALAEWRQLAA